MAIATVPRPAADDHVVHFFGDEESLVSIVAGRLGAAVVGGETAIIIATPIHRDRFQEAMAKAGLDTGAAEDDGRLIVLDAEETLSRFYGAGALDAARFEAVVGTLLRDAVRTGRQVRVYGEMVALLWDAGDVNGALALERGWNQLGQVVAFSLLCAYPEDLFAGVDEADAFAEVCQLHGGVLGGAPAVPTADVTRRFPRTPQTPRLARRFVHDVLGRMACGDVVEDALLVVTELTTNAILHAGSDVVVGLTRLGDGVRIVISDRSSIVPAARQAEMAAGNGRGLLIIDALARKWGHDVVDDGKLIWVDLAHCT